MTKPVSLRHVYVHLFDSFGPQHWWPGDTRLEIIVGAILTQNTNWGNVEAAIRNLKAARVLSPRALERVTVGKLAQLIRPSGYFNIKARRIKNFMSLLFENYGGSLTRMGREPLDILRSKLLKVNGIGPETADSILLYAFGKPVFVVDAYTKRFLSRHGIVASDATYHDIQGLFLAQLDRNVARFNEYHALIVRLGKEYCRPKPRCELCPLSGILGRPQLS